MEAHRETVGPGIVHHRQCRLAVLAENLQTQRLGAGFVGRVVGQCLGVILDLGCLAVFGCEALGLQHRAVHQAPDVLGLGVLSMSYGGWDTHNQNFDEMDDKCPPLDRALAALLADLDSRGMLEDPRKHHETLSMRSRLGPYASIMSSNPSQSAAAPTVVVIGVYFMWALSRPGAPQKTTS